ncbi:hypothetical protein H310_11253 [Aphanomyces invadans]|uniref:Uncharacterized protein n=1 Tax=Aphanomyces invadans TaxID=157072 RepID=A0A024TP28_9STRA|nr:hypothetical protein H310_11253 [Aphanomyces invadans]ETV95366.1 hypothetical protein H310_11253 [Aphanomyces invadans]|eukprot:XP_008876067.1 hypothetical protein H310_11253 [Aphanomyces invadans]
MCKCVVRRRLHGIGKFELGLKTPQDAALLELLLEVADFGRSALGDVFVAQHVSIGSPRDEESHRPEWQLVMIEVTLKLVLDQVVRVHAKPSELYHRECEQGFEHKQWVACGTMEEQQVQDHNCHRQDFVHNAKAKHKLCGLQQIVALVQRHSANDS